MSTPLITWDQLQRSKTEHRHLRSSAHMLECIEFVHQSFPNAQTVQLPNAQLWQLMNGENKLSNEHPSHYECWHEAAEIIRSNVGVHP